MAASFAEHIFLHVLACKGRSRMHVLRSGMGSSQAGPMLLIHCHGAVQDVACWPAACIICMLLDVAPLPRHTFRIALV